MDTLFNHPLLEPTLKQQSFERGQIIEQSGKISKRLYFIKQGLIRVYYRSEGREICCHFAKEGEFITGIDSFFTGKPSIYTSEALECTTCTSITKDQLEWAFDNIEGLDRVGRQFITTAYIDLVERYNSMVSMNANERYQLFLEGQPDLLNRIPLGNIASFLGMTQETLSRIRKNKS